MVRRVYLSPPLGAVSQSPANKDAAGSAPGALAPPLAQRLLADPPNWAEYLGYLFTCGAVGGTLLDGVHSRVGLQVYDVLPLTLLGGTLRTSLLVPPLLGAFYAVLGTLFALSDNYAQSGTPGEQPPSPLCTYLMSLLLL